MDLPEYKQSMVSCPISLLGMKAGMEKDFRLGIRGGLRSPDPYLTRHRFYFKLVPSFISELLFFFIIIHVQ